MPKRKINLENLVEKVTLYEDKESTEKEKRSSLEIEETFFEPIDKDRKPSQEYSKSLIRSFRVVLILFISILTFRMFYLQVIKGEYYKEMASLNKTRREAVPSARGIIYDSKNRILVRNIPSFDLVAIPLNLPKKEEDLDNIILKVCDVLKLNKKEVTQKIKNTHPFSLEEILIKEHLSKEDSLLAEVELSEIPGIKIRTYAQREYQESPYFSHILGYTGKLSKEELETKKEEGYILTDTIGKTGLEKSYEQILRGVYGSKEVEVDSTGKVKQVLSTEDSIPGQSLVLTIDSKFQKAVYSILTKYLRKAKSKKGLVVALDPQTGRILSMVSIPSFDNNLFAKGISSKNYKELVSSPDKPLYNRAASGVYPPGSTIKPLVAAAALQSNVITKHTYIMCKGFIKIGQWEFPCWNSRGHGAINVTKAIAESCDVFFYTIGGGFEERKGLGINRLNKFYNLFGFGEKTGIDLPGEGVGLVPTEKWKASLKKEPWYIGDTYHVSIGQGDLLTTPLQLVNAIACIANGGELIQPRLVDKIIDSKTKKETEVQTEVIRKDFIKKSHISTVKQGMRQTVASPSGSGRELNDLPFSVAGKTGTAQFGSEGKMHAWFVSFAPYENPKIAMVVLVEGGGEGYEVAVPLTEEILRWYFNNK